jgi:hypothetical protein
MMRVAGAFAAEIGAAEPSAEAAARVVLASRILRRLKSSLLLPSSALMTLLPVSH